MKRRALVGAAIVAVCGAVSAHADERTQTVDLYVNDPTQAQSNDSWRFMASAEYWYMYAPDKRYDYDGYSGTISGGIPGGSAYVSRGPWMFMISYRPGSYSETFDCKGSGHPCDGSGFINPLHNTLDTTELEFKLRYTFAGTEIWGFQPYLLGGFHLLNATSRWKSPDYPPPDPGTTYYHERQTYDTPELGFGVLRAFSETWGLRADVSAGYALGHDKFNRSDCGPSYNAICDVTSSSANGGGVNSYLTVYHYFSPQIVGQIGARGAFIDAESNNYTKGPGSLGALGAYVSLAVSVGG